MELAAGRAIEQRALHFTWRLAAGPPSGQYAALVVPIHGDALRAFDQITVTVSAPRPTRVSVQVQNPAGRGIAMAPIDVPRRDSPHSHGAAQRHEAD